MRHTDDIMYRVLDAASCGSYVARMSTGYILLPTLTRPATAQMHVDAPKTTIGNYAYIIAGSPLFQYILCNTVPMVTPYRNSTSCFIVLLLVLKGWSVFICLHFQKYLRLSCCPIIT